MDQKATATKKTFSRETSVHASIAADPAIVWALLTRAADYPRWNSMVTSIQGEIKAGATIELKSTLDAKRTFKLKVKEFVPQKRLVWGDAMGSRVYSLEKIEERHAVLHVRANRRSAVSAVRRDDSLLR